MNYKKLITAAATTAMFIQTALPTFAVTELIISGNGSDSDNTVEVSQQTSTTVVQSNETDVNNDIDVYTNTGGNEASDNTGGDVKIDTGDADATVEVSNHVNSNVAEVENCGGCGGDTSVLIEGNGAGTENYVGLQDLNIVTVFQNNNADINNNVEVVLETGNNEAEDNTGGAVVVETGDADATVKLHNFANSNSAMIAGSGDGGAVELIIRENGSDSDNAIELGLVRLTLLTQSNVTDIDNDIEVYVLTGDNEAEDNTGGDVKIDTGDADITVVVDNMAGFNHAYIDDCCFENIFAKVAGNGTDTDNYIGASLDQNMSLFQDNSCGGGKGWLMPMTMPGLSLMGFDQMPHFGWGSDDCFDNDLDLVAVTGDNEVEDNTGEGDSDPLVKTGNSKVDVDVENFGGSNSYGDYAPAMGGESMEGFSFDFEFSFSFGDLLAALLG